MLTPRLIFIQETDIPMPDKLFGKNFMLIGDVHFRFESLEHKRRFAEQFKEAVEGKEEKVG